MSKQPSVAFLNPRTCGIYKDGGTRYKTDPKTGLRTNEIDNELLEYVTTYLKSESPPGTARVALSDILSQQVLVPTYYDHRYDDGIRRLLKDNKLDGVTIGELIESKQISVRGGHGSPSNDQRAGHIPYVKVSDIRGLRININPTNLVSDAVAARFWRGPASGLEAWDLITPNRASSNIGEFAILLPGEEQVVLTKEVFVFRIVDDALFDAFYLLWALSLKAVCDQWRRIALMQTNREDCGARYREVVLPNPPNKKWALDTSEAFRAYFTTIANAKETFVEKVRGSKFEHVANVISSIPATSAAELDDEDEADQ
jgi:type I restriction enzyme M protein